MKTEVVNKRRLPATPSLRWPSLLMAVGVAVAVTVGSSTGIYWSQIITTAMMYAILAVSIDLVWGYTGILSMGHAVFFGIGAYTVGLFSASVNDIGATVLRESHWWTFPVAVVVGVGLAAVTAAAVGAFSFAGKVVAPLYVAVVTLSLTLILGTVLEQTQSLGGQQGLSGFVVAGVTIGQWYWIGAFSLLGVTLLGWTLVRSDFGLLLKGIRDNENRCRYLGFNVARVKLGIFSFSGALAGFAGALYAGFQGFVSPPFVGFLIATEILIWAAVGGRGTLIGPVLGAIGINLIGPKLSESFPYVWSLILGLTFVVVVVFIPDGLLPALGRLAKTGMRMLGIQLEPTDTSRRLQAVGAVGADGGRTNQVHQALRITGVERAFGQLHVLRGVDLEARARELLCIVGPNGAGKSTLLGVLSDGSVAYKGSVIVDASESRDIRGLPPHRVARLGVGRKFQAASLCDSLTAAENLLLASCAGRMPSMWRRSRTVTVSEDAYEVARVAGLLSSLDVAAKDLSHGSRQALELCMSVATQPKVLLLDEPTAGLTAEERATIGGILRRLVEDRGMTVILIEHDFEFVRSIGDRVAVLHEGRILEEGSMDEISRSQLVRQAYLGETR